jgi:hypothetical protein
MFEKKRFDDVIFHLWLAAWSGRVRKEMKSINQ